MDGLRFAFSPELPLWIIGLVCVPLLLFCLYGVLQGLRGAFVRLAACGLVAIALLNPAILQEDRSPLKTVVTLVVDQSTSQKLDGRLEATEQAVTQLKGQIETLDNFELREVRVDDAVSQSSDISTALFKALDNATKDVPREQLGASIFITDGQVHDVPEGNAQLKGPLHVLLTGKEGEKDRRLVLKQAPRFGVVGESQELIYEVEQRGFDNNDQVDVTIKFDGEVLVTERVSPNQPTSFVFDVPHGGKNIIELEAEIADDEITAMNNRAFTRLTGIRENLRVLLVSGEPHAGERTWRNLLKSDASVDLVHFTILRPPEKQDGTPINQLSLIAFPTRELFVQKIDEFDLIIFDRYRRRGVLPVLYFDNIARYVRDGGAVLVAAGPEYADPSSLGTTPLNVVLPGFANGSIKEAPFKPQISETGLRHPVTRDLDGWDTEDPQWGRWFRSVGVSQTDGETVMVDTEENPLLMLRREGEGRVALFLSDHVWLWSRGFEGGGPHGQLLRRLAHWLMREPELEEERLTADADGSVLTITRQTLKDEVEAPVLVSPSGNEMTLALEPQTDGLWKAEISTDEVGLYRISDGEFSALAQVGPANPRELASVISTAALLQPAVEATNGSITRIADGVPDIRSVGASARVSGNGWIGLPSTGATVLNGIFRLPLFIGLLGMAILLLAMASAWWREGR